eukprot:Ihof_evm1s596 gene=Ihof_evmTU1s596
MVEIKSNNDPNISTDRNMDKKKVNMHISTRVSVIIDEHIREIKTAINVAGLLGLLMVAYGLGLHVHYPTNQSIADSEFIRRASLVGLITQIKRQSSSLPTKLLETRLSVINGSSLPSGGTHLPSLLQLTTPSSCTIIVQHISHWHRLWRILGLKLHPGPGLEIYLSGALLERGSLEYLNDVLVGRRIRLQLIAPDRGRGMECIVWYKPSFFRRRVNVTLELLRQGLARACNPTTYTPAKEEFDNTIGVQPHPQQRKHQQQQQPQHQQQQLSCHANAQRDSLFVRQCIQAEIIAQKERKGIWGIDSTDSQSIFKMFKVPR